MATSTVGACGMTFLNAKLLCRIPTVPSFKTGETAPLFAQTFGPIDPSLRKWAHSQAKPEPTDPNLRCRKRYNRHTFCAGKILPASQTAAVWQMALSRVQEPFPHMPLIQRIQREKALIRAQRESRLVLNHLVAAYAAKPDDTEADTPDLAEQWQKKLAEALRKDDRMVCVLAEIIPVRIDRAKIVASKMYRIERQATRDGYNSELVDRVFTDDEQGDAGFDRQSDHVTNDGMRRTNGDLPTQHQQRSKWHPLWRIHFNPDGVSWTEASEADVREHSDFNVAVELNDAMFGGRLAEEAAKNLGIGERAVFKNFAELRKLKQPYEEVNLPDLQWYSIVTLDGKHYVKTLGEITSSTTAVLAGFIKEWSASESNAKKTVRRTARKELGESTIRKREHEAVRRIGRAYNQAVIGISLHDPENRGIKHLHYRGHRGLIAAIFEDEFERQGVSSSEFS